VVGTSYTGSTLLALLVNAHPEVLSLGELNGAMSRVLWPAYRCSCGAPLGDCDFWRRVSEAMHRRGFDFGARQWNTSFTLGTHALTRHILVRSLGADSLDRARARLLARSETSGGRLREIGLRNAALVESVTECAGKPILVYTSKDPMRVRFLTGFSGLVPQVIHLVRHPLGFVSSDLRHSQATVDASVRGWVRRQRQVLRLRRAFPEDRWLTVRYEDMCIRTEQEVARMLDFLGATTPDAWIDALMGHEHHVLGNEMRMRWPAGVQMDLSWRTRLSGADVRLVLARTELLRRGFGYADLDPLFQ